jgi:hypothetical protein
MEGNKITSLFRFRRCWLDTKYAYYEVLLGQESEIFEIGANDDGVVEVLFHPSAPGLKLELSDLLFLIEEGRKLAIAEVETQEEE